MESIVLKPIELNREPLGVIRSGHENAWEHQGAFVWLHPETRVIRIKVGDRPVSDDDGVVIGAPNAATPQRGSS